MKFLNIFEHKKPFGKKVVIYYYVNIPVPWASAVA